jgi:hypothetical protein
MVSVWARSPSPPARKSTTNTQSTDKQSSTKQSKIKKYQSSSSSSSSSSDSSSSDSDSSSDSSSVKKRKSKKKRISKKDEKKRKKEKDKKKKSKASKRKSHHKDSDDEISNKKSRSSIDAPSAVINDPLLQTAFSEYEMEEAVRFRRDVQGDKYGRSSAQFGQNNVDADDDEEESGPMPMVQPKGYSDDKKVRKKSFALQF